MAETAIQFLERWREAYVYAEPRALEQLDETVTECTADAAEAGISADELLRLSPSEQVLLMEGQLVRCRPVRHYEDQLFRRAG